MSDWQYYIGLIKLEPRSNKRLIGGFLITDGIGSGVKLIAKLELTSPLWLKPLLGHKLCTRDPNERAKKLKKEKSCKPQAASDKEKYER